MLSAGLRLGHYEVLGPLGFGGMGEVYRARDTMLGRDVALKVLPSKYLGDEARQRSFLQEARAASALNHPHIVTIHEVGSVDGVDFIVMEYVPGTTLDALIRSRMELDEALRVASAVADALARAHAGGIVHRDLKPSNVVVGPGGTVKVLDFGLAKLVARDEAGPTSSEAPTADAAPTGAGIVKGTPAYMSPEQATGKDVDARSDVFSYGAVLYEMVTGRRAFHADSTTEILAAVVRDDPRPPTELVAGLPAELEKLVLRCLRKDRDRRFQHMDDVKVELLEIRDQLKARPAAHARKRPGGRVLAALALSALLVAALLVRSREAAPPPARLAPVTTTRGTELMPALSPDGEQVAFSWDGEASSPEVVPNRDIWLKLIGSSEARRLTAANATDVYPSWSPDGRQIAFIRSPSRYNPPPPVPPISGVIHVVSPLGGADRRLSDFPAALSQLSWSRDGRWLAARRAVPAGGRSGGGLYLIPANGGEPLALTSPADPGFDIHPAFSPDGTRLAYAHCADRTQPIPPCDAYVMDLDADSRPRAAVRRLTRTSAGTMTGLTWTRDGSAILFSAGLALGRAYLWRVGLGGDGAPERVELAGRGAVFPAAATSKDRLLFTRSVADSDIYEWRAGRPARALVASSFEEYAPSFSPDGRRIAFESGRSGETEEIWLADADGSNPLQLTRGPGHWQGSPRWSPDGRRIVFESWRQGQPPDIWTIDVDGGSPRQVTHGALTEGQGVWSRDGRWIYYNESRPEGGRELWRIPVEGGTAERLTTGGGLIARESADGVTLFFTQRDATSPLLSRPVGGGPVRHWADCILSRSLADGPDGMYYLGCPLDRNEVSLYRLDPATGRSQVLGMVETGGRPVLGMAVSPDGSAILYSKVLGQAADLMLIENFR